MDRMRQLVDRLNETAYQYYTLDAPTISDKEWDALYDELVRLIEEGFEKAVDRDEAGVLRAAVEHPTDFWARAKAALRAKVREDTTAVARTEEASLVEKIRSLSELPAEEFKAKVLAMTGM